jgi:hypothetical protein
MIEGTAAQTSLQPKSRDHDTVDLNDIVKRALAHMQDLNRDQKIRFISLVNQIYNSSYQDNGSMSAKLLEPYSGFRGLRGLIERRCALLSSRF